MREQYDKTRTDSISTKGIHSRKVGDIVSLCHPQPKLPKLTFQWTESVYVVTSACHPIDSHSSKYCLLPVEGGVRPYQHSHHPFVVIRWSIVR